MQIYSSNYCETPRLDIILYINTTAPSTGIKPSSLCTGIPGALILFAKDLLTRDLLNSRYMSCDIKGAAGQFV